LRVVPGYSPSIPVRVSVLTDRTAVDVAYIPIHLLRLQTPVLVSFSQLCMNVAIVRLCLLVDHVGDEIDLPFLRRLCHVAFTSNPALACFLAQFEAQIPRIEDRLFRSLDLFGLDKDLPIDFFLCDHHVLSEHGLHDLQLCQITQPVGGNPAQKLFDQ
jgi:hypothetical protein